MTRVLRWSERATADLLRIAEFVARSSPESAVKVATQLLSGVTILKRHPFAGKAAASWLPPDVREFVVSPYRIFHRVDDDAVVILAIVHGREELQPLADTTR